MALACKGTSRYIPEDSKHLADLCDAVVVVRGERLPVSSAILALHSRFLGKMIVDLQNDPSFKQKGKFVIPLDDSVAIEDAVLMLSFIYGKQTELETAEEAYRMVRLADKYDIPTLMRACATKIKSLAPSLHFLKPQDADGGLEAARWLALAERLEGMEELRTECLYCILRDMVCTNVGFDSPEMREAIKSLDANGVSASAIGGVAALLAYCCRSSHRESIRMHKAGWCDSLRMAGVKENGK